MAHVLIKADSRYPVDRDRVRSVVEKTLAAHNVESDLTISVAVVGERKMKQVNRDFHGEDKVTDVLSFPYLDPQSSQEVEGYVMPEQDAVVLGDLLLCYPVAVKQAQEKGVLVDEVVDFLVEHGMLHLLGVHHD